MKTKQRHQHRVESLRRQQGVVLYVSIVILIAMTLAGLLMMRTTSVNLSVAGNLAFKQNSTSVADVGVESARAWLTDPATTTAMRNSDQITGGGARGYYSSWHAEFDPRTFDWSGNNSFRVTADDGTGNEVRYVIHRLCSGANMAVDDPAQQCVTSPVAAATGFSAVGISAGNTNLPMTIQPYFRITTRVAGPRNTMSYIQVIMN